MRNFASNKLSLKYFTVEMIEMLIDTIIDFCDEEYNEKCNCKNECTHPSNCPNGCESCLEQVHFPTKSTNGRIDYNCDNIINYYTCKYMYKYSSEIEYALYNINKLNKFGNFNILSIGCGACPDLVAIENFCEKENIKKSIHYYGIDMNTKWSPIHDIIKQYAIGEKWDVNYKYEEINEVFKQLHFKNYNILILQYVISHFLNTGKVPTNDFFDSLIKNVIQYMPAKSLIIINDVNSYNRGRNSLYCIFDKLEKAGIKYSRQEKYFDFRLKSDGQRIGSAYINSDVLHYSTDIDFNVKYSPWLNCTSFQLIIELG